MQEGFLGRGRHDIAAVGQQDRLAQLQVPVAQREPLPLEGREREVRALREVMATLGQKKATIVTLAVSEEIRVAEGTIRVIPLWRWAIERAAA